MLKFELVVIFASCIIALLAIDDGNLIDVYLNENDTRSSKDLPFVQIGRKLYLIEGEQKVDWFEAAHICRTYKAQLASIESSTEIMVLSQYLIDNGHKDKWLWLSGNDLSKEGSFFWLGTGNAMRYTRWSAGQPDNEGGIEHCVHLWAKGDSFYMNDRKWNEKIYYICEKDVDCH